MHFQMANKNLSLFITFIHNFAEMIGACMTSLLERTSNVLSVHVLISLCPVAVTFVGGFTELTQFDSDRHKIVIVIIQTE